jgi:hypothetical protein
MDIISSNEKRVINMYDWIFKLVESGEPEGPGEQPEEPGEQPGGPGEQPEEPGKQPEEPGEPDDIGGYNCDILDTGIQVVANNPALGLENVTDNGKAKTSEVAKSPGIDTTTITSMPVFAASVKENDVAIMAYSVSRLSSIAAQGYRVKDLTLVKLTKGGGNEEFRRVDNMNDVGDGEFAVTTINSSKLGPESPITGSVGGYIFYFGIEDDGPFDWDPTPGRVIDPAAIAAKSPSKGDGSSGGGGGGCNAGFGLFGLLLAGFVMLKCRKA